MTTTIVGTFATKESAESLIRDLKSNHGYSDGEISYAYRSADGDTHTTDGSTDPASETAEGATTGAVVGGSVGALAGIATVIGVIPVIGPIFAAGPLIAALGIGAGSVGTVAASALTGALAGGVIGLLTSLGASETVAKKYEERLKSGEVLVAVDCDTPSTVEHAFREHGTTSIDVFTRTT